MPEKDGELSERHANPFAKNTYRVVNEPLKILGILDSRFAIAAALLAVFCSFIAASTTLGRFVAGGVAFAVFACQAYRVAEADPQMPLVWWLTLTDRCHASGFINHQSAKRKENA